MHFLIKEILHMVNMERKCIAWNIRKQVVDECFRYNAHQSIMNMVIV